MLKTSPLAAALATAALLASAAAVSSCTESTVIGADEFASAALELRADTLPVSLSTVEAAPSLATEILAGGVGAVYVGCLSSGPTGRTRATLGLELIELDTPRLRLSAVVVDSVVLSLPLAPRRFFAGDTLGSVSLVVESAAAGTIGRAEATFADSLERGGATYGSFDGVLPQAPASVNVFAGDSVRVDSVTPQIRIPLGGTFLDDIAAALAPAVSGAGASADSVFVAAFPGIVVRGGECGDVLPAISLTAADAAQFGVSVYYTEDGVQRQFRLVNRRTSNGSIVRSGTPLRVAYANDYADSPAGVLLDGGSVEGIGGVVQGLQGLNVEVSFDRLALGSRRGINFAELVIPVVSTEDVPAAASPVRPFDAVILQVPNSSGDLVNYSADPTQQIFSRNEGGVLETVPDPRGGADSVQQYRFNVTTLLQEIALGAREPRVFVTPLNSNLFAGESALVGEGDGELRARLRLITTTLP